MKELLINLSSILSMGWRYLVTGRQVTLSSGCILFSIMFVILTFIATSEIVAQPENKVESVDLALNSEALEGMQTGIFGINDTAFKNDFGQFTLPYAFYRNRSLVVNQPGYALRDIAVIEYVNNEIGSEQSNTIEGDEVFVRQRWHAQTRSNEKRKESYNFNTAISSEQLDRFTDYTVEEAMVRVPGVQGGRLREINIRGVGLNKFNVTVDGQRMGTTGTGDRSFDLGSIPVDLIHGLEVLKVVTPDMDADALSGVVNIVTRYPDMSGRELTARAGGGFNTAYLSHMGPDNRASFTYADMPLENLSMAVSVSHHSSTRGWESLGVGYDVADFGNGPEDVIERITPGFQTRSQNMIGGRLRLAYQASNRTAYHFNSLFNSNNREFLRHRINMTAGGEWLRPDTTDAQQGRYTYDMHFQENNIRQYVLQLGGRHFFDSINLDYNAGWAHSSNLQQHDETLFNRDNLNYTINWGDRLRPTMFPTNFPTLIGGNINPKGATLAFQDRIFDNHSDDKYSGNLNVEIPYQLGSFKLGSSALLSRKSGDYSNSRFTHPRRPNLFGYNQVRHGGITVFDIEEYEIPYFVDPHGARAFYNGNRPLLNYDRDRHDRLSEVWNYSNRENIYAGYGMTILEFGRFEVLGGLRVEYTDAEYEGRKARFNDRGEMAESVNNNHTTDYLNLFPNAQIAFAPGNRSKIRAAYSQTIARPDYNLLAPFESSNIQDSTLFRGNPGLDPMTSENLDFLADYFLPNSGVVSVGLFHKQLSGFVYERHGIVDEGDYAGFHERTFVNSDETATIYGVEISWIQHLAFLPGFLGNFSTFANYTWSDSVFDVDYRNDEVRLPHQSPHVVNAALDYTQGRFSTQVSYHWTAATYYNLQESPSLAPSIHPSQEVYMDYYQDGWSDLSVSFRFRVSNHFRFWADAFNLMQTDKIQYAHSRDLYPVVTDYRGGRSFNLGVRYDF